MTIYDLVKHLADERKLKISTIENAVGISNGSISKWKKTIPKIDNLCKVANYLDCDVKFLLINAGYIDDASNNVAREGEENYATKLSENQKRLLRILDEFEDEKSKTKFIGIIKKLADEVLLAEKFN